MTIIYIYIKRERETYYKYIYIYIYSVRMARFQSGSFLIGLASNQARL